jgi:pimeloyl-ACP methyl ester carboxylesterase
VIAHRDAHVNGVRLHYATAGTGPLMVFVHGFPEFWYAWKAQLVEFGRDHQAVAPDMRGYNLSEKPAAVDEYRIDRLVEDLRALAEALGQRRFTLVAHDWGGVAAWVFAMMHPTMLDHLVIVNAPHPGVFARELAENPAQQQASQYMLLFQTPQAEQALSADGFAALQRAMWGQPPSSDAFTAEDRTAYLKAWGQPGALTGGLNYYRAARIGPPVAGAPAPSLPLDPAALVVRVPTLVIWGERDEALLTGNLRGLEAYVSDLTVRRIPDGTHWVVHEQPERVNRLIREYLGRA